MDYDNPGAITFIVADTTIKLHKVMQNYYNRNNVEKQDFKTEDLVKEDFVNVIGANRSRFILIRSSRLILFETKAKKVLPHRGQAGLILSIPFKKLHL